MLSNIMEIDSGDTQGLRRWARAFSRFIGCYAPIKRCDVTAYILWKNVPAKLPDSNDRAGPHPIREAPPPQASPLISFTPL